MLAAFDLVKEAGERNLRPLFAQQIIVMQQNRFFRLNWVHKHFFRTTLALEGGKPRAGYGPGSDLSSGAPVGHMKNGFVFVRARAGPGSEK